MRLRLGREQEKALKDFLDESPINPIVLAALTAETNDDGIVYTPAEDLAEHVKVPKLEVIRVFRALAKMKMGQFFMGRRGLPSRIVWAIQPADVSRVARSSSPSTAAPLAPKKGLEEFSFTSGRSAWMPKKITKDELKDLYAWVGQQLLG